LQSNKNRRKKFFRSLERNIPAQVIRKFSKRKLPSTIDIFNQTTNEPDIHGHH